MTREEALELAQSVVDTAKKYPSAADREVLLAEYVLNLDARATALKEAVDEITLYGTSRPREMGEGDDGDRHYRRIAYALINRAALAKKAFEDTP